ncbi:MAG: efflux RND transporter periplasmic adaptor subunit [Candidatus Alcyoniella australis]|nr:efflux RND transporter periplasmic adaptor subunit [Candidatus Alcyoniella australis]
MATHRTGRNAPGMIITATLATLIALLLLAGCSQRPVTVQSEISETRDLVETVQATARIQPVVSVDLSADLSGQIVQLDVNEGDWVEKGQVLVRLDQDLYASQRDQARASLRSADAGLELAQANLAQAQRELARIEQLHERGLASQQAFENARTVHESAEAQVEVAKAQRSQARAVINSADDQLGKTVIHSPMSGTAVKVNKEVGEIAMGNQFTQDVIMVVADLSAMECVLEVDENDVVKIQIGDSAKIEVDALPDDEFSGTVTRIAKSPLIKGLGGLEETTSFEVKVTIEGPIEKLLPGMSATVDVEVDRADQVVAVPLQCLTKRDPVVEKELREARESKQKLERPPTPETDRLVECLFVIQEGQALMRPVTTGISSETHVEIKEGIESGEEIVAGSYKTLNTMLHDGLTVEVSNVAGPGAKE